jgi:BsuBI/PstI restriction endonuclease domain/BsuBI/PstI restriction endonuclease HTH domain
MSNSPELQKLVLDTLEILKAFGVPIQGLTPRRKEKMAKAFLAVAGIKPGDSWDKIKSNDPAHRLKSRDVIQWMNKYLNESIADSSYDDIRRKDLVFIVEAGIILKSAGKENSSTNDGTRAYALNPEFCEQIKLYGTNKWGKSIQKFMQGKIALVDLLNKQRELTQIPVIVDGKEIEFSPGEHNQLQKAIVEKFLTYFGHGSTVLYIGDTADKYLHLDTDGLKALNFFEIAHDKLPDVLAYSKTKNWLYLIEAVHSSNPITEMRKHTLKGLTKSCSAEIIYVTAFLTRDVFRKFAKDIAWETEVWIAETPEHLIHFNGDKFLGPHYTKPKV